MWVTPLKPSGNVSTAGAHWTVFLTDNFMSSKDPALLEDDPQRRDRGRAGDDPETTRDRGCRAL